VKKLEDSGVITGYHAVLNGRLLGMDITAFIGVSIGHPKAIGAFEKAIAALDGVLECHHVTGRHTLLLKVKTQNTSSLEELIAACGRSTACCRRKRWSSSRRQPSISSSRWTTARRPGSAVGATATRTRCI
jgi:DNA-binding Lrp family transcriptional regulator